MAGHLWRGSLIHLQSDGEQLGASAVGGCRLHLSPCPSRTSPCGCFTGLVWASSKRGSLRFLTCNSKLQDKSVPRESQVEAVSPLLTPSWESHHSYCIPLVRSKSVRPHHSKDACKLDPPLNRSVVKAFADVFQNHHKDPGLLHSTLETPRV